MSETPTIVQAFAAVMEEVTAVRKTGHNQSQNYSFRGIDGVVNAVGPALRKHGVVIIPTCEECSYRDVEVGKNRTLMREVTVRVRYTAHGPAGDKLEGVVYGESMDSGDKGTAKAFSVAYRTFLLQALTIPTDEPDPDTQTYERAGAPPKATKAQRDEVKKALDALHPDDKSAALAFIAENGFGSLKNNTLLASDVDPILDEIAALAGARQHDASGAAGEPGPEDSGSGPAVTSGPDPLPMEEAG